MRFLNYKNNLIQRNNVKQEEKNRKAITLLEIFQITSLIHHKGSSYCPLAIKNKSHQFPNKSWLTWNPYQERGTHQIHFNHKNSLNGIWISDDSWWLLAWPACHSSNTIRMLFTLIGMVFSSPLIFYCFWSSVMFDEQSRQRNIFLSVCFFFSFHLLNKNFW